MPTVLGSVAVLDGGQAKHVGCNTFPAMFKVSLRTSVLENVKIDRHSGS